MCVYQTKNVFKYLCLVWQKGHIQPKTTKVFRSIVKQRWGCIIGLHWKSHLFTAVQLANANFIRVRKQQSQSLQIGRCGTFGITCFIDLALSLATYTSRYPEGIHYLTRFFKFYRRNLVVMKHLWNNSTMQNCEMNVYSIQYRLHRN